MAPRIAIAEDHGLVKAGLAKLLESEGFEVVASVSTGDELLQAVRRDPEGIDAVVTDHRMPEGKISGLEAAIALRRERPGFPVMIFSVYVVPHLALQLVKDDPRGVGYLLKQHTEDVDHFAAALRRVIRGESVIDPTIVETLVERVGNEEHIRALTDRERHVMELVAEGYSNRAIADMAFMSPKTVEGHIRSAFAKLGIPDSDEAAGVNRRVSAVPRFLAQA